MIQGPLVNFSPPIYDGNSASRLIKLIYTEYKSKEKSTSVKAAGFPDT